jgi:hypothetical protein
MHLPREDHLATCTLDKNQFYHFNTTRSMKRQPPPTALFDHHEPPKLEEVKAYFSRKGAPIPEAEDFYHVYEHRHWRTAAGNFCPSWRVIACRWIESVLRDHAARSSQAV